jgi:leader peptidase (prepilin peptidase) / N-methyltransferase
MQMTFIASLEVAFEIPELIGYIFVFAVGACIGSFLNVVIHRVPHAMSLVFPNSECPLCNGPIAVYDNIPIISWLVLGAKCRKCSGPIHWRYPAVELLTALVFLLTYWQLGFSVFLPVGLAFVAAVIALIFIDSEHMILPNVITYPLFIFALVVRLVYPILFKENFFSDTLYAPISSISGPPWLASIAGALLGALVGGGSLWLVGEAWKRFRGVDAMGLGDVKMMLGVGALLGWRLAIVTIFLGAFSGAVIGGIVVLRQKNRDLQTQIPFGIFLGIGAIVALLFGDRMIDWYLGRFVM